MKRYCFHPVMLQLLMHISGSMNDFWKHLTKCRRNRYKKLIDFKFCWCALLETGHDLQLLFPFVMIINTIWVIDNVIGTGVCRFGDGACNRYHNPVTRSRFLLLKVSKNPFVMNADLISLLLIRECIIFTYLEMETIIWKYVNHVQRCNTWKLKRNNKLGRRSGTEKALSSLLPWCTERISSLWRDCSDDCMTFHLYRNSKAVCRRAVTRPSTWGEMFTWNTKRKSKQLMHALGSWADGMLDDK